ncbi:hypothetical protein M422DRAFT_272266 [Sphaerobolus stellatus SS14]|uniref:Uncharacterized protein n=1 Tax=Sphaerobolus stellatus (strain SS14) TaxID=990650 RepID=A0A0C9UMA1_SPHS4|nr:hypothetical protein M422DRAFT_272266 [Sphaerobolus stellatus SS14]
MPPVIPPQTDDDYWEQDGDPTQYLDTRWFQEPYPQLALIPDFPWFDGICLQRLSFTRHIGLVERVGTRWRLQKDIADSWLRLEVSLSFIAKKLLQKSSIALHLYSSWLPMPSTYGYRNIHSRARFAVRCAQKSQSAFLGLLATVSMGIMLYPRPLEETIPDVCSPWVDYIAGFEGVDRAWVEDLARSFVGHFDTSRIGAIVEVSKLSTWEMVRELYRVGIPLWYCWGELESKLERTGIQFLDEMAPPTMSEVEIESYYTRPRNSGAQPHHSRIPKYGSEQYEGEHWTNFFIREKERHCRILESETAEEREERLKFLYGSASPRATEFEPRSLVES